jgi:hypothetical protein
MKLRLDGLRDEGGPIFGAENEVDDDAIEGLRHCLLSSNVIINRPYNIAICPTASKMFDKIRSKGLNRARSFPQLRLDSDELMVAHSRRAAAMDNS